MPHFPLAAAEAKDLHAREGPSFDGCGDEATPLIPDCGIDG
jgi:hypothetical protein